MLFNPQTGAAERKMKVVFFIITCVWLAAIITIGTIAGHFIIKYW